MSSSGNTSAWPRGEIGALSAAKRAAQRRAARGSARPQAATACGFGCALRVGAPVAPRGRVSPCLGLRARHQRDSTPSLASAL